MSQNEPHRLGLTKLTQVQWLAAVGSLEYPLISQFFSQIEYLHNFTD